MYKLVELQTTNEPYYRQTTLPDLQKRKPSAYRQKKKYLICYIHHIVNRKIYDCLTLLAIHVPVEVNMIH